MSTYEFACNERSSARISFDLLSSDGESQLSLAQISALRLTVYVKFLGVIVNGRNHQSILNANGGVVASNGHVVLTLSPEDNQMVDRTQESEPHMLLIEWEWDAGDSGGNQEIQMTVQRIIKIV